MVATPKARALGLTMRNARIDSRLTLRELASRIGRHSGEISRWETGERPLSPERAAQILSALGITGPRYDEIVSLAYDAQNPPWVGTTMPERARQLDALIQFERAASRITAVSPLLVHGLLQEESYIRAIMNSAGDLLPAEVSERVEIRLKRRDVLTRSDPVALRVFLGESVLHQLVGDRQVMAAQFCHLLRWRQQPNIELRVIPYASGFQPALEGAFTLIESDQAPPIVQLESRRSTLFLHQGEDIRAYRDAIAELTGVALGPVDSARVIAGAATRLAQL